MRIVPHISPKVNIPPRTFLILKTCSEWDLLRKSVMLCLVAVRVLAFCEDSHALRLTSKLVDLRAANANRRACFANARQIHATPANTKGTRKRAFCVGWGGRIRTDECQSQSLVPYRLATPQYSFCVRIIITHRLRFVKMFFSVFVRFFSSICKKITTFRKSRKFSK